MKVVKFSAIALIVVGVLGLVNGSFAYIKNTHQTKLGAIELSIKDKKTISVPVWASMGAVVTGGLLLLVSTKRRLAQHMLAKLRSSLHGTIFSLY